MLMANLHYVKTFFNPYLLVEAHLHATVDAKKAFNWMCYEKTLVT